MSRTKAKKKVGHEERPVFVESVPPAMVAEVFEVAGADDDVIVSSTPPPPERPHGRPRMLSIPPAPHPPRPSATTEPSVPEPVEAKPVELGPEDLEPLEPATSSPELRTALLTPLPTEATVRPRRPAVVHRGWLAIGSLALVFGVVLGVRLWAAPQSGARPPRDDERVRVTTLATTTSDPARTADAPHAPPSDSSSSATVESPASEVPSTSASVTPPDESPSAVASSASTPNTPLERRHYEEVAPAPEGTPFDTQAASAAITAAFQRAASCRGPSDPSGSVTATLTYAPSGRVTTATVSGVFAGTPIGGCIASALRGARVPAFSGERLTVKRTVELH